MLARIGFRHGVHPPEHKELTHQLSIRRMPFPDEVVLPLRQHAGNPAIPVVKAGDHVERGDMVARADGFISVPIHASAAGTVTDIDWRPHIDGTMQMAICLSVDKHAIHLPRPRLVPKWDGLSTSQVIQAVQDAGVVGLGGAAFPTHVKLTPPKGAAIHTLIVNGAECEPYLTSDHRTMVEYPQRVLFGIRVMMQTLGVKKAVIGVENNKPDAVEALRANLPTDIDISVLPLTVKYPQGAEKMLIHAVTGEEVGSGKLPVTAGVIVQNVGSIAAVAEIFETGLPLIERIVTVSGDGVRKPQNLIVPVGTKLVDLLDHCGGLDPNAAEVIVGGPMMGLAQSNLEAPVTKGTTGVVVLTSEQTRGTAVYPCIHCGRCLDACPVFLNPSLLGDLAKHQRWEAMEELHLTDCMLCGSCSYVCPSNIPLSQQFAFAKAGLRKRKVAAAALAANGAGAKS